MRRYDRSTAFIEFVIVAACGVYRRRTHVARPPDANKHNWVGVAYFPTRVRNFYRCTRNSPRGNFNRYTPIFVRSLLHGVLRVPPPHTSMCLVLIDRGFTERLGLRKHSGCTEPYTEP